MLERRAKCRKRDKRDERRISTCSTPKVFTAAEADADGCPPKENGDESKSKGSRLFLVHWERAFAREPHIIVNERLAETIESTVSSTFTRVVAVDRKRGTFWIRAANKGEGNPRGLSSRNEFGRSDLFTLWRRARARIKKSKKRNWHSLRAAKRG